MDFLYRNINPINRSTPLPILHIYAHIKPPHHIDIQTSLLFQPSLPAADHPPRLLNRRKSSAVDTPTPLAEKTPRWLPSPPGILFPQQCQPPSVPTNKSPPKTLFFTPPNPLQCPPALPTRHLFSKPPLSPPMSPPPPPGSHQPYRFPLSRELNPPAGHSPITPHARPLRLMSNCLKPPLSPPLILPPLKLPHIPSLVPTPSHLPSSPLFRVPFPLFPHPHPTTQSTPPPPPISKSPEVSVMVRSWRVFSREGQERREGKGREGKGRGWWTRKLQ